jgi:hypothetical protein
MALANLIAKAEAKYTQFETRKTARLTKRAEELALTPEQRTAMLAYDTVVAEAIERGDEQTAEQVSKEQATNRAKLSKAEKAAKAAEKAIRTREIKVMRRKARIAAVRYYLSSRTISKTVINPDGTETETKVQPPVEVQEGVEEWQRVGVKFMGMFTYPTRLFKRMWTWAKQPIRQEIPRWRRPSRIVRMAVTAVAIAVLAVPTYLITGALSIANSVVGAAVTIASMLIMGALALVWLLGSLLSHIPVVGRYLTLAVNALVAIVGGLLGLAVAVIGLAVLAINIAVHAALAGILMVIGLPVVGINALHTKALVYRLRRGVRNGNIEVVEINTDDWVAAPTAEPVAEEVIDLREEPVAEPVEEPILEGVVIEPPAAPKQTSRRPRKARPVKPNAAVA